MQVLIEAGQRLPDGRLRQRGLPLSEKMIGQEDWQTAAVRAVSEELATALPQDWRQQVRQEQRAAGVRDVCLRDCRGTAGRQEQQESAKYACRSAF
jgi:hypothetical protein